MNEVAIAALGNLVKPVKTWNPARSAPNEVFDYIDLSAIDQDVKKIVEARTLLCVDAPSRARQLVAAGDVLVSTVRPNLNGVAEVPSTLHGATASTGFCVLRPNCDVLDRRYLFHWVISPGFVSDMVRKATGASYPAVSDRIILDSWLPLPPLAEQQRIAEILDCADELRAKRRAALAHLDALTQSIFLDMFGDPVNNPMGWDVSTGEDICERITVGIVIQPASHYQNNGVPALRSLNIRANRISMENLVYFSHLDNETKLAKTRVWADDILLVRSGQPGTAACNAPRNLDTHLNEVR